MAITRIVQENPDLASAEVLSMKYGLNRQRMIGIIIHPDNNFPAVKVASPNNRIRLFCPIEVEEWRNGRDLRALPFVTKASFSIGDKAKYKTPTEIGLGGKAIGEHLQRTAELYRMMARG